MEKDLVCPICGEPTNVYMGHARKDRLCRTHGMMQNKGELIQCENCGKWNKKGEFCYCQNKEANKQETSNEIISDLMCITCEEPSNGKHFCIRCYKKYKDKVLYIKVKNCKDFDKLASEYESDLVCDDGHMVKSPYEKIIDNWLYSEGIKHAYEPKIDIDETRDITPDFYVEEYKGIKNIYIEFWGYDESNKKYQKIREYKEELYPMLTKRDNIAVIYLNKSEVDDNSYKKKIKYAKAGEIKI